MKHLVSLVTLALLLVLLTVSLSGCGGGDDCFGCGPLRVHFLTLYLKVVDAAGTPLPNATISLDNVPRRVKTTDFFRTVIDCGCSFEGFHFNWRTVDFEVDIPTCCDQTDLHVLVTKPGFADARVRFTVTTAEARFLVGHATLVMQPLSAAGSASPVPAPEALGELLPAPR